MSRLCEGRVAIVTGAGQGVGREHALPLAAHGAKSSSTTSARDRRHRRDTSPGHEVVETIRKAGGEALINSDDVSDWNGAKRWSTQRSPLRTAGRRWSTTPASCATACSPIWPRHEWDAVMKVHLKGTFAPSRHAAATGATRAKARRAGQGRASSTPAPRPASTARRPDQLRRGQGRHRRVHDHAAASSAATASPSTPSRHPRRRA